MRRSMIALVLIVFAVSLVSGCSLVASPVAGGVFTSVKWAGSQGVNNDVGSGKVGSASATSILGAIGIGDASIAAAMSAGGVSKVHHVDYESKSILGIFGTFTTHVYGD